MKKVSSSDRSGKSVWISPQATERLKTLGPVFRMLSKVDRKFIKLAGGGECAYWYGERAHIGLFSASVWRCGGAALEEYRVKKKGKTGSGWGRCDLWIKIRSAEYACEARHIAISLKQKSLRKAKQDVQRRFRSAKSEARRLIDKHRLALCFVTIRVPESNFWKDFSDLEQDFSKQCEATVWVSNPPLNGREHDGNYLGVLLGVAELKRL